MQLYYTDRHGVGGPSKLAHNLGLGLQSIGEEIEVNPPIVLPEKKVLFSQTHPKMFNMRRRPPTIDLSRIIIGPNICVLPIDSELVLNQGYHKLLVPSKWVYDKYARWIDKDKLQIWPIGIDTESFSDFSKKEKQYDCLIYHKNRSTKELNFVMKTLIEFEQSFNVIKYGSYNEQMFLDSMGKSKYCFLLDNTESQGIAMEEIMSCNLPMFVWNMRHWDHRGEEYKVPATSVPYWSELCGEKTSEKEKIKDLFSDFLSKIDSYNPRQYVLDNLTLEQRTKELLSFYDFI